MRASQEQGLTWQTGDAEAVQSVTGRGSQGRVQGTELALGSLRWMEELQVDLGPLAEVATKAQADGHSVSVLASRSVAGWSVLAVLAFGDEPKPGSAPALAELRRRGMRLFMVSGDNQGAAEAMARRLAREEALAASSQAAARAQARVNEVIIDNLSIGVLVVDLHGVVRNANPAAQHMLMGDRYPEGARLLLAAVEGMGNAALHRHLAQVLEQQIGAAPHMQDDRPPQPGRHGQLPLVTAHLLDPGARRADHLAAERRKVYRSGLRDAIAPIRLRQEKHVANDAGHAIQVLQVGGEDLAVRRDRGCNALLLNHQRRLARDLVDELAELKPFIRRQRSAIRQRLVER